MADGERVVRVPEAEQRTGLCRTSLWRLEKAGEFPARRAITGTTIGWLDSELTAWLQSRPVKAPGGR